MFTICKLNKKNIELALANKPYLHLSRRYFLKKRFVHRIKSYYSWRGGTYLIVDFQNLVLPEWSFAAAAVSGGGG